MKTNEIARTHLYTMLVETMLHVVSAPATWCVRKHTFDRYKATCSQCLYDMVCKESSPRDIRRVAPAIDIASVTLGQARPMLP